MARKSPGDLKAAKEKKQKKIAIAGAVLLVIILGVQVPRTMKMLNAGQAQASEPAATSPDPASAAPAAPSNDPLAPPTLEEANPTETPAGAAVVEPSGQLVSFSRFESKDPFAQQIDVERSAPNAGGEDAGPGDGILEPDPDEGEGGGDTSGGAEATLTSAEISVNGVVETVALEAAFPQAAPMFLLYRLGPKSATIKVAEGGSFASGGGTLDLEVGKPVTLVNTADGTRFVIELKSVG